MYEECTGCDDSSIFCNKYIAMPASSNELAICVWAGNSLDESIVPLFIVLGAKAHHTIANRDDTGTGSALTSHFSLANFVCRWMAVAARTYDYPLMIKSAAIAKRSYLYDFFFNFILMYAIDWIAIGLIVGRLHIEHKQNNNNLLLRHIIIQYECHTIALAAPSMEKEKKKKKQKMENECITETMLLFSLNSISICTTYMPHRYIV